MTLSLKHTFLKGVAVTSTLFAATVLSTDSVRALTVVDYNFDSGLGPTGTAANTNATPVTAGTPPGGSGITYNLSTGAQGGTVDGFGMLFDRNGSDFISNVNQAVANNSYFEFTVQPNTGTINLQSFEITARSSFTSTGFFSVRSSQDTFASDLLTQSLTDTHTLYSLTLPAAFQNLSAPTTFRVYSWDTNSSFATTGIGVDRIQIDDGVPIPFGFTPLPGLAFAWVTATGRKVLKCRKLVKEAATVA